MKKLLLALSLLLPTFAIAESDEGEDSSQAAEVSEPHNASNLQQSSTGGFDPKGIWFSGERRSKVEVTNCAGDPSRLCGKIIALKEPIDPETKKPKVDKETGEPMMGLEIFKDFKSEGDNHWADGTVRDPKEGKTYSGKFTMVSNNRMDLRGYWGISLLGRTQEWERTTKDSAF